MEYTFGVEGLQTAMVGVFDDIRQMSTEDKRRMVEFILKVVGNRAISFGRKNKTGQWNDRVPARLVYIGNQWPTLEDNANALATRFGHLDMPNSYFNPMRRRPTMPSRNLGVGPRARPHRRSHDAVH